MQDSKRQYFGTDGIRAKANQFPMDADFVQRLGRAAGMVLGSKASHSSGGRAHCVLGRDSRASGEMLEAALSAGFLSVGVDVIQVGVLPTPAVAYLTTAFGADFGAIVSASHNPFEDNGVKFVHANGEKLSDATEFKIEQELAAGAPERLPMGRDIGRLRFDATGAEAYIQRAIASMQGVRLDGMRLALDAANGAAHHTSVEALRRLGAEVSVMATEPDGYNINESCGCTHPEALQAFMAQGNYDVGIAHDGDADRVLLCDAGGCVLDGDELLALATRSLLERDQLRHRTVAVTVMSNLGLDAYVRQLGAEVVRTAVGDRYVLEAMREHDLNLGGEQSGHLIFRDWCSTGDGLIAALQLLRLVVESGKPLAELKRGLVKYPQLLRNYRIGRKPPLESLTQTARIVSELEQELNGSGRVLLRYSGTEPLIRVMVEAPDAAWVERAVETIGRVVVEELA